MTAGAAPPESVQAPESWPKWARVLARFYGVWLERAELWIGFVLTIIVIVGLALNTIGVHIGSASLQLTITMTLTFYLCLFGGVIATRRVAHIAVDAILPRLKRPLRLRLQGASLIISAGVAVMLTDGAWDYVARIISPTETLVFGVDPDGWLNMRLWRWPIGLFFAWMALHFLVGGVVRVLGKEPWDVGLGSRPKDHHAIDDIGDADQSDAVPASQTGGAAS